ncbi:MAG TPA: hypothetical protein VIT67_22730 [Povalibacter sp.]
MNDANHTHVTTLRIAETHPSLPGHFPGNPVVPAVVLLDHVQQAAQRWLGRRISVCSLSQAKFLAPLLPEQDARIQLRLQDKELRFTVLRAHDVIAQGSMIIAIGADAAADTAQ